MTQKAASPTEVGPADRTGEDPSPVSVGGRFEVVKEQLAIARPVAFREATCSCGSSEIEGACVRCGDLVCGRCAILAGLEGVCCEACRFGRAID